MEEAVEDDEVQPMEEEDGESDDRVEEAPPRRQQTSPAPPITPQKPRQRHLRVVFTPKTRKALKRATTESLNPSLTIKRLIFNTGKTITLIILRMYMFDIRDHYISNVVM